MVSNNGIIGILTNLFLDLAAHDRDVVAQSWFAGIVGDSFRVRRDATPVAVNSPIEWQDFLQINSSKDVGVGIPTPGIPNLVASSSGGSLATGTYYYKITALDGVGETAGGTEASAAVTGPNGSVAISWTAVPGATSYRIYRGTSAGGENVYYTTTGTSFTDTGAAGTSGSPPATTSAYINRLAAAGNSWLMGGNLGIGAKTKLSKLTIVARPSSAISGTVAKTAGSSTLTGTNTKFLSEVGIGDRISVPGVVAETKTVTAIASDTSLTVDSNFANTASGQTATLFPSILRAENSNNVVQMVMSDQGNIGIGTANPFQKVHTVGTIRAEAPAYPGRQIDIYTAAANFIDSTNDLYIRCGSTAGMSFSVGASQKMGISNNGNVGIGTTTPGEKLEVNGNIKLGGATVRSGTGGPNNTVTGNVGDLYLRTDGGSGSTLYVKESGNGTNTGWTAK